MVAASLTPSLRSRRHAAAVTSRTVSTVKLSDLPKPTTNTREGPIFPKVWMIVISPLLAFYLTFIDELADGTVQRTVHRARRAFRLFHPVEQIDYQRRYLELGNVSLYYLDIHVASLPFA